ncbi:LysR family transcriptional regulator [Arthrobacter castelli]|uniref:LysR family transcriptional regulator n=1 Tax=Arthrobacter castelli TaxID=271431 RepID=UPI00041E0B62|nr:LysR family transcriptional regulator [Arthrobacter castelli]
MNFRRIEYFLAVVDAGTVTAAAELLHMAQPALSRQIRTLERELKIPLFEARGNRLVLTAAGRAYVPMARRLLVQTQGMADAVEVLRAGRVSSLVAAATAASVRSFLAPFIATTTGDDPLIITRETGHFEISDSLLHGADFIVSPAPPEEGLHRVPLGNVSLMAHVHTAHQWAKEQRTELPLTELCAAGLILPSHHSVSRYILDNAMSAAGLSARKLAECDDGPTIFALAAAGQGVGVSTELSDYGTYSIPITTSATEQQVLQLPLHAAWFPDHFAAGIIEDLSLRLQEFLTTRRGARVADQ